jgi:outer membrane protein
MRFFAAILAAAAATAALTGVAAAQSAFPAPGDDLIVTLGGGPRVQPQYEGARNYMLSPFPIVSVRFLINPFTGEPSSEYGLGFAPSFRYIGARDRSVDKKLAGFPKVDAAYELGGVIDYTLPFVRGYLAVRQGFGGHHGQVADVGVEGIFKPFGGLKIAIGPKLAFASKEYMETYFSVPPDRSGPPTPPPDPFSRKKGGGGKGGFQADAGLNSYGPNLKVDYDFTPQWTGKFEANYSRLAGDAADSPLVQKIGSRNQITVGFGLAYRFGVDYR